MRNSWKKTGAGVLGAGLLVGALLAVGADYAPIVSIAPQVIDVRGLRAGDTSAAAYNTAIIQAAINQAATFGGGRININTIGTVYVTTGADATAQGMAFPPCLYINSSNIAITLNAGTVLAVAPGTNRLPLLAAIGTTGTHLSNISLTGGELNANATNQTFAVDDNRKHLIHAWHVDNFTVKDCKLWPGAGSPTNAHFMVYGWDLAAPSFENLDLVGSEATLRILAPATDLNFKRLRTNSALGGISLGIGDHSQYLPSGYAGGDIKRIFIRDCAFTNSGRIQLYRVDPSSLYQANQITDIFMDGLAQSYTGSSANGLIQLGGVSDVPGTSPLLDRLTITNVSGKGAYLITTGDDSGTLGDVTLANVDWVGASGQAITPLNFTVCPIVKLTMNNVKVTNLTSGSPVMGINRIDSLVMNDVTLTGTGAVSPVFYAGNGTNGAIRADIKNLEISAGNGSVAIYRNANTPNNWSINGFYVYSDTSSGIGVFQDQSSASSGWTIALNGQFRQKNCALTINTLSANANIRITGYCSHTLETGNYAEFGYHGGGGTFSIDNAGIHMVARDGASNNNPGPTLNDRVFNTDSGLSAGVGPVICTSTSPITWSKNGRP